MLYLSPQSSSRLVKENPPQSPFDKGGLRGIFFNSAQPSPAPLLFPLPSGERTKVRAFHDSAFRIQPSPVSVLSEFSPFNKGGPRGIFFLSASCIQVLSRLILFGEGALRQVLKEYDIHSHQERHHQGKGNE